ncbi:MAG: leucine-rich repeat protein, partial [Lachnospiraceae bacterium]|nr:leucine-rich repeat protein [Lachnospiraceae bacterium]
KKTEASYSASGNNLKVTNIQSDTTTVKIPATVKGGDGKQYKVTTIGANALGDAKFKTVVLGKNIKTIEANAFNGQSKLKTITVNGKLKSVGKGAFNGINKNATIKISGVSKNDYKKNMKLLQKSGLPKGVKIVWEK